MHAGDQRRGLGGGRASIHSTRRRLTFHNSIQLLLQLRWLKQRVGNLQVWSLCWMDLSRSFPRLVSSSSEQERHGIFGSCALPGEAYMFQGEENKM